jgi:hypothetical protein
MGKYVKYKTSNVATDRFPGIPINWVACNQYRINAGPIDHSSVITWAMFMDQIDPRMSREIK